MTYRRPRSTGRRPIGDDFDRDFDRLSRMMVALWVFWMLIVIGGMVAVGWFIYSIAVTQGWI